MWDEIVRIFTATPLWELVLIFFSRIIEVSIGTLRIILISKGFRKQGVLLAFIEVMMWVFIASRVIIGINEEPLKAVIYSLGFAGGVYVGSKLENKIAYGKILLQSISTVDMGKIIANSLREEGIAITELVGRGKDSEKMVLMIYTNRKGKDDIIEKIRDLDDNAMVITHDVSILRGGYMGTWRRFVK